MDDVDQQVEAYEAYHFEEERIKGDKVGEVLVNPHSMLAPSVNNKDDWLHKNMF